MTKRRKLTKKKLNEINWITTRDKNQLNIQLNITNDAMYKNEVLGLFLKAHWFLMDPHCTQVFSYNEYVPLSTPCPHFALKANTTLKTTEKWNKNLKPRINYVLNH